jgi:hypothetical protein
MPPSWRTSDLTVLGVAAAGTVLLTAASFMVAPDDTLPRHDGSSYAVHRDGARAAFVLLKELGYGVERSFEPVAAFRYASAEDTALVIASPLEAPSEQDRRALRAFLESGGLVLAAGPMAAAFLPGLPPQLHHPLRTKTQAARIPSSITSGVPAIEAPWSPAPLLLESPYVTLYGSDEQPAVLSGRFAKGRAIWWAAWTPLGNGALGRPGHAELLVNMLGPPGARRIVWDEFYHGHRRSFWSYTAGTPLPIALLQLAALGGAALFTYSRRRRPIRARVVEARTSPLEFIETMGGLYERARAANAAIATVYGRARRKLLVAAGLPPSASDDRLAAAAQERLALDAGELSRLLANARIASEAPDVTPRQAVEIVGALQDLARAVNRRESHINVNLT